MGTRADFYVGTGKEAQWLGSIAFDGYNIDEAKEPRDNTDPYTLRCWNIKNAKTEDEFRKAVADFLAFDQTATKPEDGWPWPWDNSQTTDYAYCFDGTKTVSFSFGRPIPEDRSEMSEHTPKAEFPDMSGVKNVTLGPRSGLTVLVGS